MILEDKTTMKRLGIPLAKLQITSRCDLRCKFCFNSDILQRDVKELSFREVKDRIDLCRKFGIDDIELYGLVSEILTYDIENFRKIIEYLESLEDIQTINLTTSLVDLKDEHIDIFKNSRKIFLKISWYGDSKEKFLSITRRDRYEEFIFNAKKIENMRDSFKEILVTQMFDIGEPKRLISFETEIPGIFKWPDLKSHKEIRRRGRCEYLGFGILLNGEITACGWCDQYSALTIGNVEDDFESILNKLEAIFKSHEIGAYPKLCSNCKFFSAAQPIR